MDDSKVLNDFLTTMMEWNSRQLINVEITMVRIESSLRNGIK